MSGFSKVGFVVYFVFSVLCAFLIILFIDRVTGIGLGPGDELSEGLLFYPHSQSEYHTTEFDSVSKINGLGFRDREFKIKSPAKIRILAIGDSFTYGWGVDIRDSWPKQLELRLKELGFDIEVANLGRPGGSPYAYAETALKAVPLLSPNLVIIGVLQGDDLAQCLSTVKIESLLPEKKNAEPLGVEVNKKRFSTRCREALKPVFPSLDRILSKIKRTSGKNEIQTQWQSEAKSILSDLTPETRATYDQFDNEIKSLFTSGKLNPPLVKLALTNPHYYSLTLDLSKADAERAIEEMSIQFSRVREISKLHHSEVLVVPFPFRAYLNDEGVLSTRKLGFQVPLTGELTENADKAIAIAAAKAGVGFLSVTKAIRRRAKEKLLYFPLDGHANALGDRYFAEELAPLLKERLLPRP